MYMKLKLLYKNDEYKEITIKRVFQQRTSSTEDGKIERLYYEEPFDDRGKAKSVALDELCCWDIEFIQY